MQGVWNAMQFNPCEIFWYPKNYDFLANRMVNKLGKKSKLETKLSSAMPNNLQISLKCVVQSTNDKKGLDFSNKKIKRKPNKGLKF